MSDTSSRTIYRIWKHTNNDQPIILTEMDGDESEDHAKYCFSIAVESLPNTHLELERTELVEHDSWLILSHNAPETETPPK